ncbi:RhoGAP domain containing protein [Trichomonas vaginalis G3]|uniref:RhoGAP domain containing protein n=1 Tax=Trichomonas vaginalis (strain ATCC PRA-98 / G3) TaxID=412133 RepID=A2DPY8_TRIV3|nr:Rho GTPase activation protein domain-containing protein [Trichomonas vaginalis G3]EAY17584.1 RhoGAP domain containing protein [Trichomonas vaginalis G3]KAI5520628.1 Rho GTPase activation protein domain-containing protein [Trichomonas vaginalis G3]|eukprot:XP_001329719.1 RhoGAP domain containing protein [Trichomonas vaginalis G3]
MDSNWTFPVTSPHFLTKTWNAYNGSIPFIISDLVKAIIEKGGMDTEGIFRVKDENKKIDERYLSLDDGKFRVFPEEDSPVLLSCVLKKVLQTMSTIDPLFSLEKVNEVLKLTDDKSLPQEKLIESIKEIAKGLAPPQRNTAAYLMDFLHQITLHPQAKMDAENMAICLGVCLVTKCPPDMIRRLSQFLHPFIEYSDQIWEKEWFSEDKILTDQQVQVYFRPIVEQYDIQIEAERRSYRVRSKIPVDHEYNDKILGIQFPR